MLLGLNCVYDTGLPRLFRKLSVIKMRILLCIISNLLNSTDNFYLLVTVIEVVASATVNQNILPRF